MVKQIDPMGHIENEDLVPMWVKPMLKSRYFTTCLLHAHSNKSECNFFCIDCHDNNALCSYCLKHHQHHRILQIRRSSYHDVIRVSEIQRYIDVSGVQNYVINSAKIVFLNERPQHRVGRGFGSTNNSCQICCRALLEPFKFCSLGCKVEGMSRGGGDAHVTLMLPWEFNQQTTLSQFKYSSSSTSSSSSSTSLKKIQIGFKSDGCGGELKDDDFTPVTPPIINYRKGKPRKGIPHRAPF
ncbi:hypothetical protein Scep_019862 [Stephania cephalantha]|uniref:PLATZ transcription factor family protein n=1 Tax=Stephania cephalantha TaxID=152367 RepID=A0AAP0NMK4_9MAGN